MNNMKPIDKNNLAVIAIAVAILCISASATYGAFQNMEMGARPLGMGSAFVANADGASAIFWNPAGVNRVDHCELTMSYVELYGLVSYSSLGYAYGTEIGSMGLGLVSSSDVDGVYRETTLALSAAREFHRGLNVGMNVKYLSSAANTGDIRIGGGRGVALDLGCQYQAWKDMVFLGVSLQNLVSHVSYNREAVKDIPGRKYSENLDLSYRIGSGIKLGWLSPHTQNTVLAAEVSDNNIHIGAEHTFRDTIAARIGYRTGNALTRSVTAGFGLRLSAFRLDYAYIGSEVGAETSQFSFSVDW